MTVKKAELHVHLEGTITPSLAQQLAARNHLAFPTDIINADGSYRYRDFLHFLSVYDVVAGVIKQPQDYYDLTMDYLKSTAMSGCIYVEMMYSPDHAEMSSGIPSSEHLQAIQQAINDAEAQFGIVGRIIMTAVRHFGAESAVKVAKHALKEKDKTPCIVGLGLGGDEHNFPPRLFKDAYQIAAEGGLSCTVHAGEFASHTGMMEALDNLPIKRIGHGVMAIHSPETIARLIDMDIALEVCPSSNIKLGLFPDLHSHPLIPLMNAGIRVSLSSDDPPFFSTTLADEYQRVQQFYQYSDEQMLEFTRMALEVAFVDNETKTRLLNSL